MFDLESWSWILVELAGGVLDDIDCRGVTLDTAVDWSLENDRLGVGSAITSS
jgi:hypothetical protein